MPENILGTLPNKPLVEALFEFKWGPDVPEILGYPIVVGALYEHLKNIYPDIEDLPLNRVPHELTSYMVRQRFRKTKEGWPLVQIGPGILTVNDTEGYTTWDGYYNSVYHVIEKLYEAHPKSKELVPQGFLLRYINAVEFDFDRENVLTFLESKFKTKVVVDKNIFAVGSSAERPGELILRLSFPLGTPKGSATVQFSSGVKLGKPALIWELIVSSSPPQVAQMPKGASAWLQEAHNVIEHWFIKLTEGDLLERFKRKP